MLAVLASLEVLEEWFPDVDEDLDELAEPEVYSVENWLAGARAAGRTLRSRPS
ncbi:hypothetical protein [Wenzhouxiangella sp. EGI_FJ10305]|uniref:hypothetical protein n=1 Tax=Wenzhouxiangella sp. EGI_FJ10305 TaxID=3243768 RepID=UPI0035DBDC78